MSASLAALAVRMASTAGIVVAASLAAERAGPFLAAMVATLPVSMGPAYLFLALDHDSAFVARSAETSLLSVGSTAAFVVGHAATAGRAGSGIALATALAGWAAYAAIASRLPIGPFGAFALSTIATLAGMAATRRARAHVEPRRPPAPLWHVGVRAMAVMALVAGVTLVGALLGPEAAGAAVLLPVVFICLVLLLQPRLGGRAVAAILSHGLAGMLGYGPALLLLALTAVPLGSAAALGLALAACLGWNGLLLFARERGARVG